MPACNINYPSPSSKDRNIPHQNTLGFTDFFLPATCTQLSGSLDSKWSVVLSAYTLVLLGLVDLNFSLATSTLA